MQNYLNSICDDTTLCDNFVINWSRKGVGFGQLTFKQTPTGIVIDAEMMSKEFVKKILQEMIDNAEIC